MGGGGSKKSDPSSFQSHMETTLNTSCEARASCQQDMESVSIVVEDCPNAEVNIVQNCSSSSQCSNGNPLGKVVEMVKAMNEKQKKQLQKVMNEKHTKNTTEDVSLSVKTYLESHCKASSDTYQKMRGNSVRFSCTPKPNNPFVFEGTLDANNSPKGPSITLAQKGNAESRCITNLAGEVTDELNDQFPAPKRAPKPAPSGAPPPPAPPADDPLLMICLGIIAVLFLALIGGGIYVMNKNKQEETIPATTGQIKN